MVSLWIICPLFTNLPERFIHEGNPCFRIVHLLVKSLFLFLVSVFSVVFNYFKILSGVLRWLLMLLCPMKVTFPRSSLASCSTPRAEVWQEAGREWGLAWPGPWPLGLLPSRCVRPPRGQNVQLLQGAVETFLGLWGGASLGAARKTS